MKTFRIFALVLLACITSASAANVTFNLSDILQTAQPLQRKTVVIVPQSTPRTNATNVIVISEPRYFNIGTNASFVATNLVYGNYLVSVWGLNATSNFRILVPQTNGALYASDLLVTSNSVPGESAGYTQSAANNRFVLRNSGWASNLIVTNLTIPVGAANGYVLTSDANGKGSWAVGGSGGIATNAQPPSTVLTNISSTGVSPGATNASAYISSSAGRGTNIITVGLTNIGAFSNSAAANIGGALDVGGTAEFRNTAAVYTELNVFGDINQDTAGGYTTTIGQTTMLTNSFTLGTNDSRWLKLSLLATGSVLKLDANKLASVDDALTWASARLNESTNRLEWRVLPTDNLSNVLATVPNNTTIKLATGTYTVNASILNSNYNRGTPYIGLMLANKTNVVIEGAGQESTIISARAMLGTALYVSNCSGVRFSGMKVEGYTNHNFTMLPGYSPITTNQGAYLWALIEYYQSEKLTFENMWVDGSTDHGIWDRGVEDVGYPASSVNSTNQILFQDMLFTDIGSVRTNSTSPTTGFQVDGTAIVPTTATIRRVKVRDSLRAFEPYNENGASGSVFTGTTIEDFEIRNIADSGIVLYGTSTNGHWGTIRRGRIENDASFTWHGTNYGRLEPNDHGGYGLFLASGRGWKINDVEIAGTMFAGLYIGNATTPVDDFEIRNVTARNIRNGDDGLGVGAYIGTFGTAAADASSVRRLLLSGFEAHNCTLSGILVYGGRDITIDGYRSFKPSGYPSANTAYAGIRIGRNGVTAAGITNITVRGSRQVTDGSSAWGIAIEDNVYSATIYDNEAHGFTIAPLTNQATSAAVNLPEVNLKITNSITSSNVIARNVHLSGGTDGSSMLRTTSGTNIGTVTIGANLTFDGTTLSATGGGGGSGGTNFPPVINQRGSTNLAVNGGVRQAVTLTTNASFAFNLSGTPPNGATFIVGVSNFSASQIFMTTYVANALSSAFLPANASNVSVFAIPPTSIRWLEFLSETNFNLGTARWNIIRDQGKEMELTAGYGQSLATNAAGTYITNILDASLRNLVASGSHSNFVVSSHGLINVTNGINIGAATRYQIKADSGLFYIYDTVSGEAPIGIDDATQLVSLTDGLSVQGSVSATATNFANQVKLTGGQAASSILRLDSGTNIVPATIGSGLSFDGTTLTASGGGGSASFSYLPQIGTNYPIAHDRPMLFGAFYPNGSATPVAHGSIGGTPSISGTIIAQRAPTATNSTFGVILAAGGSVQASVSVSSVGLFVPTNTVFHFTATVGFSNALSTNRMQVGIHGTGSNFGDDNARCGWRAITAGSTSTNWVAEYYNGSAFVQLHTNSATSGQWHTLGIANTTGNQMVWYMDGLPVATNATPGNITLGSIHGYPVIGQRVSTTAGTNMMFWQGMNVMYQQVTPVGTGPL